MFKLITKEKGLLSLFDSLNTARELNSIWPKFGKLKGN